MHTFEIREELSSPRHKFLLQPSASYFESEALRFIFKMEDFVAAVKVYSDDKNWAQLVECINSSVETIVRNASKIDAAIAALDPVQNTIGFLGVL